MTSKRLPIEHLAFLSDSRTAALVDLEGSIVWYCPAGFDQPSAFASLLDPRGGSWDLGPIGGSTSTRRYEDDSLILVTRHTTADGVVEVTDFLGLDLSDDPHALGRTTPRAVVRIAQGVSGRVRVRSTIAPRFDYALTVPLTDVSGRSARFMSGAAAMQMTADVPLSADDDAGVAAEFELSEGESAAFVLRSWMPVDEEAPADINAAVLLERTQAAWTSWNSAHTAYDGVASDLVRRSAVVLQGLTDGRTGAVIAAATTSLPERLGGDWNWDYRFAWLRDLAFVMRALWVAACPDEADRFLRFLATALGRIGNRPIPIVLGSDGRRDIGERTLPHLAGYAGSRPVRAGNGAWLQRQLDVMGEVLDSAYLLRDQLGDIRGPVSDLLVNLADRAAAAWHEPDAGMWEARDRERHYTSSKVMCWTALDRAIQLREKMGAGDADRWRVERDKARETILREAWSDKAQAFSGAFGSDELDASVLLMPLLGFVDARDERMSLTIDAISRELGNGPLIRRWQDDPNGFLLCSYWLVECDVMRGRLNDARARFESLNALASDLGLMAEMYDLEHGTMLGNYPQAFSHVGLINAAWRLTEATNRVSD